MPGLESYGVRPKTTFLAQLQREKKTFFSVNEGEETGGTVGKVAGSSTVDEEEGGRKMRCGQENSHVFWGRESVGGGPVSLVIWRTKNRGIVQIISYPLPWRGILSPASFAYLF